MEMGKTERERERGGPLALVAIRSPYIGCKGHAVAQSVGSNALQPRRLRLRFPMVSLEFFFN